MSDSAALTASAPAHSRPVERVKQAIADAARNSGVDFGFLLAQAKIESGLDPQARSKTSSATGLYQFIDSTWLRIAQRHEDRLGLGGAIDFSDPASRAFVLSLRSDPQIASQMAAALAQENSRLLSPVLGRTPDDSELYLAHFLGAGEAIRFLKALEHNPETPAATLFQEQASANRGIFFDTSGDSRSLGEVMDVMRAKMGMAGSARDQYPETLRTPPPTNALAPGFTRLDAGVGFTSLAAPPLPQNTAVPSLSRVLESQFGIADTRADTGSIGDHARRAYDRLRAFGL